MINRNIPVTKIHSYNVSVAADVGINAAVVFYNICFWVEENQANKRHFVNGKYWTYNTVKALHTIFPEMTGKQIEYALKKLKDGGYIESAILSEDTRDRTNWYTVCDFKKWILHEEPTPQEKEVANEEKESSSENSEMTSDDSVMFNNINNNIDSDTDNNKSNKNQADDKPTDNSHDKYALKDVKKSSFKGDMYASVPEEQEAAAPKKQNRYIPKDYTEEQLRKHINPIVENEVKQHIEDMDVKFPDDRAKIFSDILCLFCRQYKERFGENHYVMPDKTLKSVVRRYLEPPEEMEGIFDIESYEELIDLYFKTDFNKRGNYDGEITLSFPHFMSDTIRGNLANRLWK